MYVWADLDEWIWIGTAWPVVLYLYWTSSSFGGGGGEFLVVLLLFLFLPLFYSERQQRFEIDLANK